MSETTRGEKALLMLHDLYMVSVATGNTSHVTPEHLLEAFEAIANLLPPDSPVGEMIRRANQKPIVVSSANIRIGGEAS